jgi:CBS domain containing-hemolysin-like protein
LDTIGGWFLSNKFEAKIGDSIEVEGYAFKITEMEEHHILYLEIKKMVGLDYTYPQTSVS